MLNFLIVLLPCFIIIWLKWAYYKNKGQSRSSVGTIDSTEVLTSFGASVLSSIVCVFLFLLYTHASVYDTEIWNGVVTGKEKDIVMCNHMEDCNCVEVTDKDGYKTEECDSCPEHAYDVDWNVFTTVGSLTVDRLSEQGTEEPPRWTAVKIGEPASLEKAYQNWLLMDETSLFLYNVNKPYAVPAYPRVYDYYRVDRVFNTTKADTSWLNDKLNKWLIAQGAEKQLNVIVVLTHLQEDYYFSVMSKWKGGKKNDLILVFGVDDSGKIVWQKSSTYANGMNNMHLIEEIRRTAFGRTFNEHVINDVLKVAKDKFNRIDSNQFKDKAKFINPPLWLYILVIFLNSIITIVILRKHLRT